jgi:CRISPR-associated protein Cmr5
MLTRNQKFALEVYKKVGTVSENDKPKYGTMAQKLPLLIRTAGLAQAIGFLEAKSKEKGNELLLKHLAETLGFSDAKSFGNKCRESEMTEYLRLTQNVLAALLWFKRYSVSVLGLEPNAEVKDGN